jgi:hypothetical protein
MATPSPSRRFVAIATGAYSKLPPLPSAIADSTALAELLRSAHDFEPHVLADLKRGDLLDQVDILLGEGVLEGGLLVVMWTGHGSPGPDGSLRLFSLEGSEVATAARVAEWAARTHASQVALLLDVCFAGGGVPDALGAAHAVIGTQADIAGRWFGVVAACRGDEPALSGALARELRRVLEHGPSEPALRLELLRSGAELRGSVLFDVLLRGWSEPRQTPQQASTGTPGPLLRNPLSRRAWSGGVVEHLLFAARGTSMDTNYFVGRQTVVARVVTWIRGKVPGTFVITGPAGSGKSAVIGRVLCLSDRTEREQLLAQGAVATELDPGLGSIDAHFHARRAGVEQAVAALAAQLEVSADASLYDLLALARRRLELGRPLVLAFDGLDEAGGRDASKLATELLLPLAREALILIGSRDLRQGEGTQMLLSAFATTGENIDLGADPESALADVRSYVAKRLDGVASSMAPAAVAEAIAEIAAGFKTEGPFLFARLVTSQLRAAPIDTGAAGWRREIASSVETAFEYDLTRTSLTIAGREHPTAARELLVALACAHGSGLPCSDDLWPQLASALSRSETTYGRADVFDLLLKLSRHVVAGVDGNLTVFRIAHQPLLEHLLRASGMAAQGRLTAKAANVVADTVLAAYVAELDAGKSPRAPAYLWQHAWRHLADAGEDGLVRLRQLVARDRRAFLPDLALALDRVGWSEVNLGATESALRRFEEQAIVAREVDSEGPAVESALLNRSVALVQLGRADAANDAAEEVVRLAQQRADRPGSGAILCVALMALSLSRTQAGDLTGGLKFAREALRICETMPELTDQLGAIRTIVASALAMLGDLSGGLAEAERAVSEAKEASSPGQQGVVTYLGALAILSTLQRLDCFRWLMSPEPRGAPPVPSAADRIRDWFVKNGATGTIADTSISLGLTSGVLFRVISGGVQELETELGLLHQAIELARPLAAASTEATIATMAALLIRSAVAPDHAASDLDEAMRLGSVFADTSSPVSQQLGEVLAVRAQLEAAAPGGNLQQALAMASEAFERMVVSDTTLYTRYQAITLVQSLLVRLGDRGTSQTALQAKVDLLRNPKLPLADRELHLSLALSDHAALQTDPTESLSIAQQAIEILEPMEPDEERRGLHRISLAQARLNAGQAFLALEDSEGAEQQWMLAEAATRGFPDDGAKYINGKAVFNLVALRLRRDPCVNVVADIQSVLESAQGLEAIWIQIDPTFLPTAQMQMSRALRVIGKLEEAEDFQRRGVSALVALMATRPADALSSLAMAMNEWGAAAWDEVLATREIPADILEHLRLTRVRPSAEIGLTVADLALVLEQAEHDPERRMRVHGYARHHRSRAPEPFDAAWEARVGVLPAWLLVPPEHVDQVRLWLETPTWMASYTFLEEHPDLLGPRTDVVLDEFSGLISAEETHRSLLAEARQGNAEAAYEQLITGQLVRRWAEADDPVAYLTNLEGYPNEALEAGLGSEHPKLRAILFLFQRGEQALAEQVQNDRVAWPQLLQAAWRAGDHARLAALASLCLSSERAADPDRLRAITALALAQALNGDASDAVAFLASTQQDGVVVPRDLFGEVVGDAMAHHPDKAGALASLYAYLSPGAALQSGHVQ